MSEHRGHHACGHCKHFVQHVRPDAGRIRVSQTGKCMEHSMPGIAIIVFDHMRCGDFEPKAKSKGD